MKLSRVKIKNFKAIAETTVPLTDFTVIVGTNGSGKSSVLQAIHWMLQSARNPNVSPESQYTKGSTLSEIDATYMPSPDYKNASHSTEYGNFAAAPKMEIEFSAKLEDGETYTVPMWIKSARNEGISVHTPSNNPVTAQIRQQNREVSAYIPGLAGIPLAEEKRSKRIVYRQAAAGDANTVLRNILDLARLKKMANGSSALDEVVSHVSAVLGETRLNIQFDDEKHYKINAEFQTGEMRKADPKRFKPLELAGIGFLQVIQIFAYMVYFRPRFLLIDEPDSHLHPDVQEKLINRLVKAARENNCQVVLTSHSPSVVRSLGEDTSLIWMKSGDVQSDDSDEIRKSMGWGLLDKSILLVTEDKKVGMLNSLVAQWPELDRKVAVWSARGNSKLPPADVLSALHTLFGDKMKIVLHRDADFMLEDDRIHQSKPYEDRRLRVWFTEGADLEACWMKPQIIAAHFGISASDAEAIIEEACRRSTEADARKTFNSKRAELTNFIKPYQQGEAAPVGSEDAHSRFLALDQTQVHLGKTLVAKVREIAAEQKLPQVSSFGKIVPESIEIAGSLKTLLNEVAVKTSA